MNLSTCKYCQRTIYHEKTHCEYCQEAVLDGITQVIEHLKEMHPYPADLFKNECGKCARTGYDAAIAHAGELKEELSTTPLPQEIPKKKDDPANTLYK